MRLWGAFFVTSSIAFFAVSALLVFAAAIGQTGNSVAKSTGGNHEKDTWISDVTLALTRELEAKLDARQQDRLEQGLRQVSVFWRQDDGDAAVFKEFVKNNFASDQCTLDTLFNRFQALLEALDGHMLAIGREFRRQTDLDLGPILPFDEVFAGYDPAAHVLDDFFNNKLAFAVLLNFPLTTLEERVQEGEKWNRRDWAEARLAQRFSKRIPAEVNLAIAQAGADADRYISEYNIWMHHLLDGQGQRLFPPKLRLLSHWNLRDEIKANYEDSKSGLSKQRMIQQVMERIVTQTIPAAVINNPQVDWNPFTNEVTPAAVKDADLLGSEKLKATSHPEPDTRYATLLKTYQAASLADPYSPMTPTLIARRFDENREIPEARVKAMLEQVVSSPMISKIARLIESKLGRPLEPFDIWYNGFRSQSAYTEQQLDEIVSRKYPSAEAYEKDIPNLLEKLGFSPEKARKIAANIAVDPARGSGHAMGAAMRSDKAHLRTRVEKSGMNYKSFNIAVHEMGHNVEQTLSLNEIDYTLLQGVPNTAFTEALAFVFQAQDLALLGLAEPDSQSASLKALNDFWATYEIAGVALVDMATWHWMYDHPNATPAELKMAVLEISKDTWNRYYASVFKKKDVVLLGIYSHMIDEFLYLPDYPLGHLIAHQIEEQMEKAGSIGAEFERMVKAGSIAPDLWMKSATGSPVGAGALIEAVEEALEVVR
jgi:hypothetical protein